jgi:hypothetical protein
MMGGADAFVRVAAIGAFVAAGLGSAGASPSRRQPRPSSAPTVLVQIPSRVAGGPGIRAAVFVPHRARYAEGAPVVVVVSGGVQPGGPVGRPEVVGQGFVEITFGFPTEGGYDWRGPRSLQALADVIRFARGKARDTQGRTLAELCAPIKPLASNVGLLGMSNGGNAAIVAMALHGREFANLAFYVSMESPVGEGAVSAELGGFGARLNPAYDPESGRLDLSGLAWSDATPVAAVARGGSAGPMGALFFDMDRDGRYDAARDYPANALVADLGDGLRAWYSPRLLREAGRRALIPARRPTHVPTLAEAEEFWRYRDAGASIGQAVRNCPNLAVIVYAGERDHVQVAPGHPHIVAQVEGFRKARAKFVRLNPDSGYVRSMLAYGPPMRPGAVPRFSDNDAGRSYDGRTIRAALEPAGLPISLYVRAALCEVADRTQAGRWDRNLDELLYPPTAETRPPGLPPAFGNPRGRGWGR